MVLLGAVFAILHVGLFAASWMNVDPVVTALLAVGYLLCIVLVLVQMVRLARATGSRVATAIFGGVGLLVVPIGGLVVLAYLIGRAAELLRQGGIQAGFFGIGRGDMSRLLEGACKECGYDLRGLDVPVCPECGKEK
jgi:hypothetical protein